MQQDDQDMNADIAWWKAKVAAIGTVLGLAAVAALTSGVRRLRDRAPAAPSERRRPGHGGIDA